MTTDAAEAEVRADEDPGWPEGPQRQYYGLVIIEWPAPRRKDGVPGVLAAWGCSILDAATGEPITTAEKATILRVTADAQSFIIADLVMLADLDGNPVPDGKPRWRDGKVITGVFPFLVAEMRVRP